MASKDGAAAGSGWFGKLVIVALLALAVGLYLRILMPVDRAAVPAASLQAGTAASADTGLQPLPEDQMALLMRVFAPELTR